MLPTRENYLDGYTEGLYTHPTGQEERVRLYLRGPWVYFVEHDELTRALGRVSVVLRPTDTGTEPVLTTLDLFGSVGSDH